MGLNQLHTVTAKAAPTTVVMALLACLASIGSVRGFTAPALSFDVMGGIFRNPFAPPAASPERPAVFFAPAAPFNPKSPDDLIARAKIFVASDLGLLDGGVLLDDAQFIWIGATSNGDVLNKKEYLLAGKYFNLRAAFPDLEYRSYDYRVDEKDPTTVRLTCRTVGNMRGELRLRNNIVLSPNGQQMVCPPEAISVTFTSTGTISKLCTGFCMDRLVGNTGGLCGIMAAATVAGTPPADYEVYPIPTVVGRFFGRPVRPLSDPKSYLAPFPESVMIQLTKGILAAGMGSLDPDLLSDAEFSFCGPLVGPISKRRFLDDLAPDMFGGVDPDLSHFRVDPYDPYRVWVDASAQGEFEDGNVFVTPPQALSFTFDDDGFCTRITGDAVMDPSIGNTGGLGGVEGINYAAGSPSPEFVTRPLPQVLGRLRKRALEPFTKIGVDDYVLEGMAPPPRVIPKPPTTLSPLDKLSGATKMKPPTPPPKPPPRAAAPPPKALTPPKAATPRMPKVAPNPKEGAKAASPEAKAQQRQAQQEEARKLAQARAEEKKQRAVAVAQERKAAAEQAAAAKAEKIAKEKEQASKAQKVKAQEANKKKNDADAERRRIAEKRQAEADRKRLEIAANKKAAAELKAAQAAAAKREKDAKILASRKRPPRASPKPAPKAAPKAAQKAAPKQMVNQAKLQLSRTIAIPKKEDGEKPAAAAAKPPPKKVASAAASPPRGVPVLSRWRKNRDNSVTGLISGSAAFDENERITTSPIARGDISEGSVVQTQSGSKYYLS